MARQGHCPDSGSGAFRTADASLVAHPQGHRLGRKHVHATKPGFVLVERRIAEAVLPAHILRLGTGFIFLDHPDDLLV
jgi:hypothetical protein